MKKFFALVLALVMALSLTTVALGATTVTTETELNSALATGGEITLGNNIALVNGITVAAGVEVTLNLNGKTLSYTTGHAGSTALIDNKGTLTINGPGTITNVATNPDSDWEPEGFPTYANNTITNKGILVVNGATIENGTSGSGAYYAIDNNSGERDAIATINDGVITCTNNVAIRQFANSTTNKNEVNIVDGEVTGTRAVWIQLPGGDPALEQKAELNVEGGTLTATGSNNLAVYSYSFGASYTETEINISGGTFNGDVALGGYADYNKITGTETLTITGGDFNGEIYTYNDKVDEQIEISGGTFSGDVSAYVVDGYTVVQNTDGTYILIVDAAGSSTAALYDLKQADAKGTEVAGDVGYKVVAGEKNEATGSGVLEYIVMDGKLFVKIAKKDATTSDFYVTKANEKTPLFYMSQIDSPADVAYEFIAKEFNKFGVKCDQMNVPYAFTAAKLGAYVWTNPVTGDKIYFLEDDEDFDYSVFAEPYINGTTGAGPLQILVDDEIVVAWMLVDGNDDPADPLNQHIWAPVAYDKTTPTKAQCGLCGAKANLYKDGKAPAGSDVIGVEFDRIPYDLVITSTGSIGTAVTTPSTDKVESAETFDAGIAMYVGMSVMAAAGSAVVIGKKKD